MVDNQSSENTNVGSANASTGQTQQPSTLRKISHKIASGARGIGGKIKVAWKNRKKNKSPALNTKYYDEKLQKELDNLEKKPFLARAFARFAPENIFGLMIVYFLLQDFVIDFFFGFNYGSPQLITIHIMACFLFGLYLLFAHFIPSYDSDGEASMFNHITRSILNISLIFGAGLFIEFMIIPIIQNLVSGSFITRIGLSAFESQNLQVIFTRVLKPYWGFFACLFFGRYTRVGKTYLTIIFILILLFNFSLIESSVRSTVGIFANSKYVGSGREQAKMVIEQVKINGGKILQTLNPVTWFQNYLEELKGDFSGEHVEGEYTVNADVSGVIFEKAYSSNSLAVYEGNEEPQSDANVIMRYVKSPENDCVINGICDSNNDFKLRCCVDNSKFQVSNEINEQYGGCSNEQSYSLMDLAYLTTSHTCYVRKNPNSITLLDAEEKVNVNITGEYTFQTVANKDFRFAEKSLIQRCITQSYVSGYSNLMECMKFPAIDSSSSQASSGPIVVGIGTPEEFDADVVSIDFNKNIQDNLPILISLTNKGDGKIKSLNNFYLALPKEITITKINLCKFEKTEISDCVSTFGESISNPLDQTNDQKYDCYKYDFSGLSEGTKASILEQMQKGSIHCNLKPTKEILDGDKVTKSIKTYVNYTYEISTSVDITFKNTALSKQKASPTKTPSNYCICEPKDQYSNYLVVKKNQCEGNFEPYCTDEAEYAPNYCICKATTSEEEVCSDGTKLGQCSAENIGIKCSRNDNTGSPELVSDCKSCYCPDGEVCYEPTNVCIDEAKEQQITTNICECDDYGDVIRETSTCSEGNEPVCQKSGYPDENGVYKFNCFCRQVTPQSLPTVESHGGF